MDNTIKRIITAATMAPSGDNTQPWSFVVSGSKVSLYMHPEKDHEMLNIKEGGTLVAAGAALENLLIAARAEGFDAQTTLFPSPDTSHLVATVMFAPGKTPDEGERSLAQAIPQRHTNRAAYKTDDLPRGFLEACATIAPRYAPCRIRFVTDKTNLSLAGKAASGMEEAALQSQQLHRLFFESILWDEKPHLAGEPGMHIRTLELPPPARPIFKMFRSWPLVSVLNTFGFARIAAQGNAKIYASSGGVAVFIVPDRAPHTMVRAGQCMQRIWLEAVRQGLAAQPLAGLLYLAAYVADGHAKSFSPQVAERIAYAAASMKSLALAENDEVIAMTLRIGKPKNPPTDYSRRQPPRITEEA